jgi:hypothetical protein
VPPGWRGGRGPRGAYVSAGLGEVQAWSRRSPTTNDGGGAGLGLRLDRNQSVLDQRRDDSRAPRWG